MISKIFDFGSLKWPLKRPLKWSPGGPQNRRFLVRCGRYQRHTGRGAANPRPRGFSKQNLVTPLFGIQDRPHNLSGGPWGSPRQVFKVFRRDDRLDFEIKILRVFSYETQGSEPASEIWTCCISSLWPLLLSRNTRKHSRGGQELFLARRSFSFCDFISWRS